RYLPGFRGSFGGSEIRSFSGSERECDFKGARIGFSVRAGSNDAVGRGKSFGAGVPVAQVFPGGTGRRGRYVESAFWAVFTYRSQIYSAGRNQRGKRGGLSAFAGSGGGRRFVVRRPEAG